MIFPYSFTNLSLEAVRAVSRASGIDHSIQSRDPVNPASLCAAAGMREWTTCLEKGKGELGHFYISFYIETSNIYGVVSLADIQLLQIKEGAFILTTNVLGWRDVIVNGLSKDSSTETRRVVNYIFAFMRDNGFAPMFSKYRRINLPLDGSVILEEE